MKIKGAERHDCSIFFYFFFKQNSRQTDNLVFPGVNREGGGTDLQGLVVGGRGGFDT